MGDGVALHLTAESATPSPLHSSLLPSLPTLPAHSFSPVQFLNSPFFGSPMTSPTPLHFPGPPSTIARTLPPPVVFRPPPPIPGSSPTFTGVAPSPTHSLSHSPHYSPSSSFSLGSRTLHDDLPHSDRYSLSSFPDKKGGTLATFYLDSTPVPRPRPSTAPAACCQCDCVGFSCACAGWDCSGDRLIVVVLVLVVLLITAIILFVLGFTGHLSLSTASSPPALPTGLGGDGSSGVAQVFPAACTVCRAQAQTVRLFFVPFIAPPANATDYCLNLTDATACLTSLMSTWAGHTITIPYPNVQYSVRLGDTGGQTPLLLPSGTVFNGNNCTFINTAASTTQPSPARLLRRDGLHADTELQHGADQRQLCVHRPLPRCVHRLRRLQRPPLPRLLPRPRPLPPRRRLPGWHGCHLGRQQLQHGGGLLLLYSARLRPRHHHTLRL